MTRSAGDGGAAAHGRRAGRRRVRQFRRLPPDVRSARAFAAEVLQSLGATADEIETFGLAVSELGSNAVMHAQPSGWSVGIAANGEWYIMDVSGGTAEADSLVFHPERWMIAGAGESTGRGLGIVHGLMDDVKVDVWRGSVRVVCRLRRTSAASSDHVV